MTDALTKSTPAGGTTGGSPLLANCSKLAAMDLVKNLGLLLAAMMLLTSVAFLVVQAVTLIEAVIRIAF